MVKWVVVEKIISGGQTGADRAALDWAIAAGIPHGGWCPQGRLAEDGAIAVRYQLKETPSADYAQRTAWNVRDSDGTVVFSVGPTLGGGSKQAVEFAERHGRPCLHVSSERGGGAAAKRLGEFLTRHQIKILNVAGPRQSEDPRVAAFVSEVLGQAVGAFG